VSQPPPGRQHRLPPRLTAQEVLCNVPLGTDAQAPHLPVCDGASYHRSLEAVVIAALSRPPCIVSFSGGRDSSAVLAVAVDAARRHGLPTPIPVILRHRSTESDEAPWQELVLDRLGLGNAEIIKIADELDAVGPVARQVLMQHGPIWPANAFGHQPIIRLARGGSLLTGIGGDEVLIGHPPPTRRHTLLLRAPYWVRHAWLNRALGVQGFEWLTDMGRDLVRRGHVRDEASARPTWALTVRDWYRSRYFSGITSALEVIAQVHDVRVAHPLIEPEVLSGLLDIAGPDGFPTRTAAMRRLFGHLLPDELLSRQTKASFGGQFWGESTRRFMASWTGGGVDADLVDVDRLRAEFTRTTPDFRTAMLVHQAWLHDHPPSTDSS
jgi:hypothetical protein